MMHGLDHWSHWVQDCESRGERYIVVTLIGARGSTPRASGTKMVVAESLVRGTIGGGELEHSRNSQKTEDVKLEAQR